MAEIYTGTKFRTHFTGSAFPFDERMTELILWGNYLAINQMAPKYPGGSSGNISVRTQSTSNEFIISATSTDLEHLKTDDFVWVEKCLPNEKLLCVKGTKEPSSEAMLHYAIYEKRPDVMAIFHGHWPDLMKLAESGKFIQTAQEQEYGSTALVEEVLKVLDDHAFILMKNHGFLALGSSVAHAAELVKSVKNQFTQ